MNPSLLFLGLSLILAYLHIIIKKPRSTREKVEIIILYQLTIMVGLNGLMGFYAHNFMSDWTADYIGWPKGNPFQKEVGYTNLTFGILGLLSFFNRNGFWTASLLGISIWYLLDGYLHFIQLTMHHDTRPGNAGTPLVLDILLPIFWLTLLSMRALKGRNENEA